MLPSPVRLPQIGMLPRGGHRAGRQRDDHRRTRRKYLKKLRPRYLAADRAEKGRLLTEMALVTGLHRKSLVRLLNQHSRERPRRVNRRSQHDGLAVEQAVAIVWESVDYLCAEWLQPALLPTAQHLARFDELQLTPDLEAQLAQISVSTLQRLLGRLRRPPSRLPQKGPEQANRLRQAVPMRRLPWETVEPGHCEVELVHHAGGSPAGEYGHTLQLIDVATGWSERRQRAMEAGFRQILARLPFPIRELHPDNGSEFFNTHLVRFFGEAITGLTLSRSRSYHKNDNRFVEQKNAPGSGPIWGTCAWRQPSRWPSSMPSMTRCGSTTTCSSRCCI